MWLSELEADRLRNLKAVSLKLAAGLTLLTGRNGQGKTSILESAYLLGTGRSFRTRKNSDLLAWTGGPLRVEGAVDGCAGPRRLTVLLDGERRALLVDGAERPLDAFIGRLDVVDLTAGRMAVLGGGPDERRRFLDRGVVGLDPPFLHAIGEYRRVLLQRNALLRRGPRRDELEAWDERLVRAAREVHRARRAYSVQLAAELAEAGRVLFPDGEPLRVSYRPSPSETGRAAAERFEEIYAAALARNRSRDQGLGHTGLGPHRDDLAVRLGPIDLLRYGSAGQLRASMICLKLGKLSLLRKARGEAPVFLMDDFDSDLDQVRMAAVAGYLGRGGFQALVASSKEALADGLGVSLTKVRVDDGIARAA